ncbi:MAG: helix-turn-helix transcriptional regulator [Eggerthellaceae bacterium]|nr:helix-turn-helix transcriptional regulator [Eggerthellaceae bacterium]
MTAYDETYVSGAQRRLGAMLDFAVSGMGLDLADFYQRFLEHALSRRFEAGDPAIVSGRSGEELALEVLGGNAPELRPESWQPSPVADSVYWTGWALAFYQWASGWPFVAIQQRVGIEDIRSLYAPYHEMDIRQFCDRVDSIMERAQPETNLKARRVSAGLSQSQLAAAAGIPVRTLQQYEQRQKNVNHARADYVIALARALSCAPEDLMEHSAKSGASTRSSGSTLALLG